MPRGLPKGIDRWGIQGGMPPWSQGQAEKGLLNIVSDADNILVEITLSGKLINEYAFLGNDQEGLAKDDEGFLYIAQDSGGIIKVKDLR